MRWRLASKLTRKSMCLICFEDLAFAPTRDRKAGELQTQHVRTGAADGGRKIAAFSLEVGGRSGNACYVDLVTVT